MGMGARVGGPALVLLLASAALLATGAVAADVQLRGVGADAVGAGGDAHVAGGGLLSMLGLGEQTGVEEDGTFVEATIRSLAMILVSEMGDETFIIAAIMAMRHSRSVILAGALGALYVMTVLSAMMGLVMPKLLSPDVTHKIATFMYFFFGFRLLYIAYHANNDELEEEIEEIEEKLGKSEKKPRNQVQAMLNSVFTQTFIEAFLLTFCAEWGDRSQIATITLAAHNDPVGVIIGGVIGHTICTTIAVFGGRLIASQISQKTVALAGSATFFVFGILNVQR